MDFIQINVMRDSSEIVHYDSPDIPLYIRKGVLSRYPDMRAVCHWHDDFEIIYVESGEMYYYISGQPLLLKAGDALFVNSREMHFGYSNQGRDCEFICILFPPSLLAANQILYERELVPFLTKAGLSHLKFRADHGQSAEVRCNGGSDAEVRCNGGSDADCARQYTDNSGTLRSDGGSDTDCARQYTDNSGTLRSDADEAGHAIGCIRSIFEKKKAQDDCYEYDVIGLLYSFMADILRISRNYSVVSAPSQPENLLILRKMVSFIHNNYQNAITLNEIAAAGNICKSKCCSLFQDQIHQTPFEFLNLYRLEKSSELLKTTDQQITSIALSCGFNHSGYYAKLFSKVYHCTPREYRRKYQDEEERQRERTTD